MRYALLLLVAALALTGCQGNEKAPSGTGQQRYVQGDGVGTVFPPDTRAPAPEVTGTLLDDTPYRMADGAVTVINFWASWCAPCRAEADDLEAVYQATKDQGVHFLGVDIRDGKDDARRFVAGRATYPSLFDPAGRVALGFRDVPPNTIPATLIIDRQGRIAAVIRKAVERDELRAVVDHVVAETPANLGAAGRTS